MLLEQADDQTQAVPYYILHIQIPLLDWIEYNRTNHITKVGCKSWKFMRDDVLLSYSYHKNMHVLDYFEIQIVEAK